MTKPDQDGPDVAELLPLLAALPRPQLPEEVATRLDAAIARAVAERVGAVAIKTTGQPQRPSYAPRRPRLRNVAFGSAAACVVLVLVVVFAMSVGKSASTSGSSAGPDSGQVSVLSSAPVTNPVLLSWAATALQNQSGPLHIGPAVRPGFSAAVTGIPTPDVGTSAGAASSGVNPDAVSGAGAAVACLAASPVVQEALAPRQLLSAASGEYSGRSAILLVYSNGADETTAYIVVVAVPCQGPGHTVLTSGVVPR